MAAPTCRWPAWSRRTSDATGINAELGGPAWWPGEYWVRRHAARRALARYPALAERSRLFDADFRLDIYLREPSTVASAACRRAVPQRALTR